MLMKEWQEYEKHKNTFNLVDISLNKQLKCCYRKNNNPGDNQQKEKGHNPKGKYRKKSTRETIQHKKNTPNVNDRGM